MIMSKTSHNSISSYKRYKRRQKRALLALTIFILLLIVLGVAAGLSGNPNSEDIKTDDKEIIVKDAYESETDDNEHKCNLHTHQAYEEVISYPDGTVVKSCTCINNPDGQKLGAYGYEEVDVEVEPYTGNFYIVLSEQEKHELACLIYLEGRGESLECQEAIGSVVINRFTTGNYNSLHDVIYAPGQFTPAALIRDTTPTITQIQIVNDLCMNGPTIPEYVTFFRSSQFFNWSTVSDYKRIDNTYFSINNKLKAQMM